MRRRYEVIDSLDNFLVACCYCLLEYHLRRFDMVDWLGGIFRHLFLGCSLRCLDAVGRGLYIILGFLSARDKYQRL